MPLRRCASAMVLAFKVTSLVRKCHYQATSLRSRISRLCIWRTVYCCSPSNKGAREIIKGEITERGFSLRSRVIIYTTERSRAVQKLGNAGSLFPA